MKDKSKNIIKIRVKISFMAWMIGGLNHLYV